MRRVVSSRFSLYCRPIGQKKSPADENIVHIFSKKGYHFLPEYATIWVNAEVFAFFGLIVVQGGKTMTINDALRLRIFELCEERHMTINGLCSVCWLNQSTISNIIYGRNNSTNVSTIQKICDGLEIDLPTFFTSDLFRNLE